MTCPPPPNAEVLADCGPAKILVFRQNELLLPRDQALLRSALGQHGTNTILWVLQARPGHPPGTVEVADERLLLGYVRWLSPVGGSHEIDHASWLSVCRSAHDLWRSAQAWGSTRGVATDSALSAARPIQGEARFGKGGNGPETTGFGWSVPDQGFTWAIGDCSLLLLQAPPKAERYVLDFDAIPFRAPPRVPGQRLSVAVNGTALAQFHLLPRGRSTCIVPGHLLDGRDKVEILLRHPDATRPCDVAADKDDRRLAIAFRSLALR